MAEASALPPLLPSSALPIGGGVAWLNPKAAAEGFGRLALAAQTKTNAVLLAHEIEAVTLSLGLQATMLRHALPRPSLTAYVIERGAPIDPRSGKVAIVSDPFGPILGRADDIGARMQLAGCGVVRALLRAKPTSAPAIGVDFPGGGFPGWTPPPIETFPGGGGEKLGAAPVVPIVIGAAVVLCFGIGAGVWAYGKRVEVDADTANKAMAIAAGMRDTRDRWDLEVRSGKKLEPTPLENAAAKVAESTATKESSSRWTFVAIGAAATAGAMFVASRPIVQSHAARLVGGR